MGKCDRDAQDRQDVALVEERLRLGDSVETAREVDHAAVFRKMSDARAAAAEIERLGMHVDSIGRYWMRPFQVMVTFRRGQRTDLETVRRTTDEFVALCSRHNGIYDGWGAMVVTGSSQ